MSQIEPGAIPTYGAGTFRVNIGQIAVPTGAAVEICGRNPGRLSIVFKNTDAANPVFVLDGNGASSTTGHRLSAGDALALDHYRGGLYAIATGAAVTLTYLEESL